MLQLCLCRHAHCLGRTVAASAADLPSQWPSPGSGYLERSGVRRATRFQSSTLVPLRKQLKDEAKAKKAAAFNKATGKAPSAELGRRLKDWELTVGIEIHAQLNTARKLFSCMSRPLTDITMLTASCSCIYLHQCTTQYTCRPFRLVCAR